MSDNQSRVRAVTDSVESKYGLPSGLLFKMAGQESNFTADAVSPKNARGWFQFMPDTAKQYNVSDPTNLDQSADGAGRFMADLSKQYQGNIPEALAHYNGGGKAVAALRSGKPWKETSGYLKGILGDSPPAPPADPVAPPQMSQQFTSGTVQAATYGPDATSLAEAEGKQLGFVDKVKGLPHAVIEGFKLDNSVYNYWQTKTLEDSGPPQELTDVTTKAALEGISPDHWDYILQGRNDAERMSRRTKSLQSLEAEKDLAKYGWAGITGRLVGGLADLPTLLSFVPIVGGAGVMTTAGRTANAVKMGLVMGTSNAAFEAATYQNRPLGTPHDIYMAAAMGVGLGVLTGGLTNPARFALRNDNLKLQDLGLKEVNAGHLKEIKDAGLVPTAGYESYLKGLQNQKDGALKDLSAAFREWTIGQPRDVNVPVNGPREFKPGEPRTYSRPIEEPGVPKPPTAGVPPPEPVTPPGKPSSPLPEPLGNGPRWDPSNNGGQGNLVLQGKTVGELVDYTKKFSKNPALVAVLTRVIQGIDLRKLDFRIIPHGGTWNGVGPAADGMRKALAQARGAVQTRMGSVGDDVAMFLRSEDWGVGRHGMNEETLTHELVHAVAVYKQIAGSSGVMNVTPIVAKAVADLRTLHSDLVTHAKSTFGSAWEKELNGRLGINLKNDQELLAYGLTNKAFQEFLKGVKLPGGPQTSLWNRFVTSLRGLLGIDAKDHNALSRLIELSAPLTEMGGVTQSVRTSPLIDAVGIISHDDVIAANAANIPVVFGWGLGLEHRLGGAGVMDSVRDLAQSLLGTTVGYKGHAVVKSHAAGMATEIGQAMSTKFRKDAYPAFEEWFKETGRGRAEKGKAFDEFGEQVTDYIRDMPGTYSDQVKKAGEAFRVATNAAREHINNPAGFYGGRKLGLTETLVKHPETGVESIVGALDNNPNYIPRKHDITKWNQIYNQFGRSAIEDWWANAYSKGRPGIDSASANKWAGWYVRTVEESHANKTQDLLGDLLQGTDKDALKNSLMRNGGYSEADALKVMSDMIPGKSSDAGALQASLKHRNTIDERHTETWKTKDGQDIVISLKDFTHSNAFDVLEPYLHRTAGNVALAQHVGIYKVGDIAKKIADATENKLGQSMKTGDSIEKMRKDLQFAFDRIQGIPQEGFSGLNKSLQMWRDFNVIRLMGGAVWNQATEMAQIVGSMGWKTMLAAIPELKALSRDIATGKAPHDILDHLENTIGGVGAEYIERMNFKLSDDWARNKGDTAWNRRLDTLDTKLKQFAKGTLDYTGMTPLMVQQKRIHAIALVNHFVNDANGSLPSTFLSKDRLSWMGMESADFQAVRDSLKKHTSPTKGKYGETYKLDFDGWVKDAPDTHAKFMEAIHRETRRVIQENDLASMVPIMGTTLGKTVFQFMNFSMHGWNKSLMFAANHRDFSTLSTVLHGSLFASLAYMGRTMAGSLGMDGSARQDYLDKRMSAKQIVANSIGKIAQVSLLPNFYDASLGNLTGPMFSGMRTTSDISSIASNPTLGALNSTLSLMKIAKNAFSADSQTTQHDIKQWSKLLPLNNVAPISSILNSLANDYPTSAKER